MRQLNILDDGLVLVPLRFNGIGGRQNSCARVELTNDARFSDGKGLLFL